jgi:hypothetical protein
VERVVGVFVILATLLLLTGLTYFMYHTAKRKGWLDTKASYYTLMDSASGLNVGDSVQLMGFPAGEIVKITPNQPDDYYNVTIEFVIRDPYYGYLWTDSHVKVGSSGLLGSRFLEVTKGGTSGKTNVQATYKGTKSDLMILMEGNAKTKSRYIPFQDFTNSPRGFWLVADEPKPMAEQVARMLAIVEEALPTVLSLTNKVNDTLTNSASVLATLNQTIAGMQPAITNLTLISRQLSNPQGSLGEWLIPTQINRQLQTTLSTANTTVAGANTNMNMLATNLNRSLENIAEMTGNLNAQVQANSLILSELSALVVNIDDLIQGLKRNWILKQSFQNKPPEPLQGIVKPGVDERK